MAVRKQVGLLLALAGVACVAGWVLRERAVGHSAQASPRDAIASQPVLLRMPDRATVASPQPFRLDAAMARTAMRDGELRVALPDGTTYPVRIERQFTDGTGHWNVVGHVRTKVGSQAMVLTFGADAVFGVIPKPDGLLMQVTTGPRGQVAIAPAGELVPDVPGAQGRTDVRIPPRRSAPAAPAARTATTSSHKVAAAQPERVSTTVSGATRTTPIAKTAIASAAPIDMTPVRIDVLALYSQELVALRGSKAAAETEVANLFALANQAHAASGTRVTLNPVGVQQITVEAGLENTALLDMATEGRLGVDTEALRDTYSADLATIIRPYQDGDFSCGVAWLQGEGMLRNNNLSPAHAYSVVNIAPCDPYVLAHELGHSMGSMHDRESSTDPDTGQLSYGAYAFSFGYRNNVARTIMAYSSGQPRVGYFSNPSLTACGKRCGIDERMDNVRSLNLMAPSIAMFRGTKGTASIGDVEGVEGVRYDQTDILVPIFLSADVPEGTVTEFDVQVVGGTATRDVDYELCSVQVQIFHGSRFGVCYIRVLGDDDIEPDETIQLRLVARNGTPIVDGDATVTIVADDPRPLVTGKLWFPPGVPVPTERMWIEYYGGNGFDEQVYSDMAFASPPDFTWSIPTAYGSPLRIVKTDTGPQNEYALIPQNIHEVRGDLQVPLIFRRTWLLSGQVKAAAGSTLPTSQLFSLHATETTKGVERYQASLMLKAPDYTWSTRVAEGATLELSYTAQSTAAGVPVDYLALFQNFEPKNVVFNPLLSGLPSLLAYGPEHVDEGEAFPVIVQLSDYAGTNGVSFRYRTVDGSAKAGTDYVAVSGTARIEAGEYYKFIDLQLPANDRKPEQPAYFDVVIDQISGATGATTTVRTWISDDDHRTGGTLPPTSP